MRLLSQIFINNYTPKNTVSFTCSIGEPATEKARSYFSLSCRHWKIVKLDFFELFLIESLFALLQSDNVVISRLKVIDGVYLYEKKKIYSYRQQIV